MSAAFDMHGFNDASNPSGAHTPSCFGIKLLMPKQDLVQEAAQDYTCVN